MKKFKSIAACALLASTGAAFAHGDTGHSAATPAPAVQLPWGIAGQSAEATRTITVAMTDDMRFSPAHFSVRQGETVRLRVENRGRLLHEMVLGTPETLQKHADMMRERPGMEHAAPHMAHVAPGEAGDLPWRFNRAGTFDFACLVAGHYEAGMRGTFTVAP
ncbi:cupredoxin family protein [Melaminivora sp.]|uniref:cupredoxin domain-containing protein n=1 Tax=Melaminivora sp. TaxID=1933032 RepID=UPI0028ABEFB0|nr:cupredoxin family protein [Melaminivora sp.]